MSGEKSAPNGPLRNGNPRRDLSTLPCCGARTRQATECRQPAMRNGRCRFHGGHSTGARTVQGKANQIDANTKHGLYGDAGRRLAHLTRMLKLAAHLANHGIHPTAKDKTFGTWITAQMAADPDKAEPTRTQPPRPILISVTPPRAAWRAQPRRRWTAAHCLRHRWGSAGVSPQTPPGALPLDPTKGHSPLETAPLGGIREGPTRT